MKPSKLLVPLFSLLSTIVAGLTVYLLMTKTFTKTDIFLQTCGELLKDFQNHIQIIPPGFLSTMSLLVALASFSLVTIQTVAYFLAIRKFNAKVCTNNFPNKLNQIISRHKILVGSVELIDSTKLTAFTIGIRKTRIVVSSSLCEALSEKELESVVLHELYHLQKKHPFWSFLISLISRAFFFVPVVEHLAEQIKIEFELLADTFVIESQGTSTYLNNALLLNIQSVGSASNFSAHSLEKRIDLLMTQKNSLEKIPIKKLLISLISLSVMSSIAILQPKTLLANPARNIESSCQLGSECVDIDCSHYSQFHEINNFSSHIPASFSF